MNRSLQRGLLLGTGVATAVILAAAGMALYMMMRSSLTSGFDRSLHEKAETLASLVEQDWGEIELEFADADMAEFSRTDRPEYFQVWLPDGTVVQRSPSLGKDNLPRIDDSGQRTAIQQTELPDGRPGRIVTLRFQPRHDDEPGTAQSGPIILALARDLIDVQATLAGLRYTLAIVGVLATLASVGALAWRVRTGLKPVDDVARDISGIDERKLSARVGVSGVPQELVPVVNRLNELLERMESAFSREKTLTADVAHELRTPLAGLRSTLEVALLRDRETAEYREALSESLSICDRTQAMVESLLALARLDAAGDATRNELADIEVLVQEAWRPYQADAGKRALNVRWALESGLTAQTDVQKLRTVLNNVLANAVHHSDAGGRVTIESRRLNGHVHISVSNTGCRLTKEGVEHVFERFWRGDAARRHNGSHYGLGLSLTKTIVDRLGGRIHADTSGDGVFSITMDLPSP